MKGWLFISAHDNGDYMTEKTPLTYADAGVDIDAGDRLVDLIKPLAAATRRPGADAALGGFGSLFDLKAAGFEDPVLVSGTDGVGTKLMIAFATGIHDTIGIDLVAMCANDILAQGAQPLFFLDYFASGRLEPDTAASVISGVAKGCQLAGCALIGGETAEMPAMYADGHYDLAGFVVGAAERGRILPKTETMQSGDVLIALSSSGPHSNGYSLIRKIVERSGLDWSDAAPFANRPLSEALLEPTTIYTNALADTLKAGTLKGLAHITGGGLIENPPRMCPSHLMPKLDDTSWTPPPVFDWLQEVGQVEPHEMWRTFNMGIGMLLIVSPDEVDVTLAELTAAGIEAWVCGHLSEADA